MSKFESSNVDSKHYSLAHPSATAYADSIARAESCFGQLAAVTLPL